jgi:hypothetical protein
MPIIFPIPSASFVGLLIEMANGFVLFALDGKEMIWVCLGACAADVSEPTRAIHIEQPQISIAVLDCCQCYTPVLGYGWFWFFVSQSVAVGLRFDHSIRQLQRHCPKPSGTQCQWLGGQPEVFRSNCTTRPCCACGNNRR